MAHEAWGLAGELGPAGWALRGRPAGLLDALGHPPSRGHQAAQREGETWRGVMWGHIQTHMFGPRSCARVDRPVTTG